MNRPPGEPLTPPLAQEVCQRTGSNAVIAGSISSLGSKYLVGLSATDCSSGDAIANEQASAPSKEDVVPALGKAATYDP